MFTYTYIREYSKGKFSQMLRYVREEFFDGDEDVFDFDRFCERFIVVYFGRSRIILILSKVKIFFLFSIKQKYIS